jgi:glycosyltransferase involved in cell wall biosynthesis
LRLLVDAQSVQSSSSLRGIGRYTLCLLRALVQEAGAHRVEVLLNGGDDRARLLRARTALELFLPANRIHVFDADWPWQHPDGKPRRPAAEAAYAAAVASLRPDAVLVASVFEGDRENVLSLTGAPDDPPTAALLYDLIPASDPGTYLLGPGSNDYWRRFAQLQRADLLLSISDYSAAQARDLLQAQCPPTVTVWGGPYPSGDFPTFESQHDEHVDLQVPERFLLAVGGDHPRKNLDRLVQAWGRVPRSVRAGTSLVIACGLNRGTVRRLRRLARGAGLSSGELLLTGRVSESRLAELYAHALAFVFPSTEEGLGMPPIEAMAAGCPTLLSRSSSLIELSADAQSFFDGGDVQDIAHALSRLMTDDTHREHLRSVAAASAQRLTWANAARRAWHALEQLPVRTGPVPPMPVPVGLDAVTTLPEAPAPIRVDAGVMQLSGDESGTLPLVTLQPSLRAILAPAIALVVDDPALVQHVIAAGIVDLPVVGPSELAVVAEHDLLGRLAPRMAPLDLTVEHARALVEALVRPSRWTLQRPHLVWLLLTESWVTGADQLRREAMACGAILLVGRPGSAAVAAFCDLVAVEAGAVDLALLETARSRGTIVVAVQSSAPMTTPNWCREGTLDEGWSALFRTWCSLGRTTGWPWRD